MVQSLCQDPKKQATDGPRRTNAQLEVILREAKKEEIIKGTNMC